MATRQGSIERDMPRMTYRVIPQTGARYSVEMVSRTGKRSLVEVFRDQAASGRMDRANCAYADLIEGIRYRPATGRALMHLQPTAGSSRFCRAERR